MTIYIVNVFNLRGNCRLSGEGRRKERENVFGEGTKTLVSITILVKKPNYAGKAKIYYHDIGDYLTRKEKLEIIKKFGSILNPEMELSSITPNEAYDWVNMRNEVFKTFIPIEANQKYNCDSKSIFVIHSRGFETSRDAWVYNSSRKDLIRNVARAIEFYNNQVNKSLLATQQNIDIEDFISYDPEKISWSSSLISHLKKRQYLDFVKDEITVGMYRPFFKQHLYKKSDMIHRPGHFANFFPTPQSKNLVICVPGIGVTREFSVLMVNTIPDLELIGKTQCFPLYYYEKVENKQRTLFEDTHEEYIRKDAISGYIMTQAQKKYGANISKEDIFFYVYALLHSVNYRRNFSIDLKKMLPRIPLVEDFTDFLDMSKIGHQLSDMHVNYEQIEPYTKVNITGLESNDFDIKDISFEKVGKEENRQKIIFNSHIVIDNIPLKAYEYILNGKSAIEWIMERYRISTHKDSQIINDPNLWSQEHNDPSYVFNLLLRIISLSVDTLELVNKIPKIMFYND